MPDTSNSTRPLPLKQAWEYKYPAVPSRIIETFERPDPALVEEVRAQWVPDIAARVGVMYTMHHSIRPAYTPIPKMVGPAFTVKVPPGDNLMVKKAIFMAEPGDVIVVDARGFDHWCLGGGDMIEAAQSRGVHGIVMDGCYRDIDQVQEIGFPMFLRGVAPAGGPKSGPGEMNVPVCCGGVIVEPGDVVAADHEGITVVPQRAIRQVLDAIGPGARTTLDKIIEDEMGRMEFYDALLAHHGCEWLSKKP